MAFLSNIIQTGVTNPETLSLHLYNKQKAAAAVSFDTNIENEVKRQLKINNIVIADADWDTFVADRLTKATITDGELTTHYILLDATTGEGNITDFGTVLAKYFHEGYTIDILSPAAKITSFE